MPAWFTSDILRLLWHGLLATLVLSLVTLILSFTLGVAAGTMRLSRRRIWRWLAAAHIVLHRHVPALVLIIFWVFAVPNLFPLPLRQAIFFDNATARSLSSLTRLPIPYYAAAAVWALVLNSSAYIAELFRAGVGTIAQQHADTARSLGATPWALFWHVLLPQGVRAAFPAIATRLIHTMKNTALAGFISVPEFFHATQTAVTRTFQAADLLLAAALVYLLLSALISALLRWIERLLQPRRRRLMLEGA